MLAYGHLNGGSKAPKETRPKKYKIIRPNARRFFLIDSQHAHFNQRTIVFAIKIKKFFFFLEKQLKILAWNHLKWFEFPFNLFLALKVYDESFWVRGLFSFIIISHFIWIGLQISCNERCFYSYLRSFSYSSPKKWEINKHPQIQQKWKKHEKQTTRRKKWNYCMHVHCACAIVDLCDGFKNIHTSVQCTQSTTKTHPPPHVYAFTEVFRFSFWTL